MAEIVEFFCSSEECPQTKDLSPNDPSNSSKNQPQHSNTSRGRKMNRVRGGRAGRKGRNVVDKDASDTQATSNAAVKVAVSDEDKNREVNEASSSEMIRRSRRKRTPTKLLVLSEPLVKSPMRMYKCRGSKKKRLPGQPDVNQDGSPFCCDRCGSNYIVKPSRCQISKDNTAAPKKKRVFGIRYKIDPETKKRLTLCNACGIRFDRMQKNQHQYKAPKATEQDKIKYQEDAKRFASSLVEGLKDPDAHRLACLYISSKPCGCMQRYIIAEGNMEESRDRANTLLKMIKDAKKLKDKKSYNVEELLSKGKKFRKVGLGNGHKRSKEFEEFVLGNRQHLRNSLKFCERACQRILSYSNNFLHKKLKTEPERRERIQRTKGKMALGLLKDIAELPRIKCCEAECTMMASSHAVLLKTWRERANSGQAEARKVLAEMLTPTGKVCNCANFVTLVTGCSLCTIQSVSEQMKVTGGDREPPAHGLKTYWKNNPRRLTEQEPLHQRTRDNTQQQASKKSGTGGTSGSSSGSDNRSRSPERETPALTTAELRDKQVQLKRLQQQLEEQQRHIVHQQMVIEQQLQKHKLAAQQQKHLQKQRQQEQQQHAQEQQQQQQQQQDQQLEILQAQQTPSEHVSSQSTVRQQAATQQATTTQQQMTQLAAQQQILLQQLGAQQIAQQLAVQQQQVASTGTAVGVMQQASGLEGMMDGRQLQQSMQQLLQEIQNQINVQQNSMQQLLLEMQSEMTTQQLQQLQQLGISTAPSSTSSTATPTVTVTASQPPPSYNAAVTLLSALNSSHMLGSISGVNTSTHALSQQQAVTATRPATAQPAPVIIQAIPAIQQNFLLGGASLHGQILPGPAGDARPTQSILVSLPPSLTTESITSSALTSTPISQDNLNSDIVEIVELQQIPLSDSSNQPPGNGLQQVNLTSELDAATLARLSRVLNTQDLRPGMGASLPQLHSRPAQTATSSASELAESLTRDGSTDGQGSSSSSLPNEAASQLINIESLLPDFQLAAPNGQGLPVFKQGNTNKAKH